MFFVGPGFFDRLGAVPLDLSGPLQVRAGCRSGRPERLKVVQALSRTNVFWKFILGFQVAIRSVQVGPEQLK